MLTRTTLTAALGLALLASAARTEAAPSDEAAKYHKQLQTSKDAKVRINALQELGRLGQLQAKLAAPAIPDIMKALKDGDPKVRSAAAITLGKIDPENKKEAVDALIGVLKNDKALAVREAAAQGLGQMGPDAREAVPALREAAKSAGKKDSRIFQMAIREIQGKKKN